MQFKRFLPLVCCALLLGAKFLVQSSFTKSMRTPSTLNPTLASYESKALKTFALGLDNAIAGVLWVDLLQNAKHTPVADDQVSWEYASTESITTLDPRFERAYSFGATFLSVFRRDKEGGRLLLEKWVRQKRNSWQPLYMLGVHYYLEMNNYEKAAPLILRASTMEGAPQWISSLGIRLLSEQGALMTALKSAIEIYPAIKEEQGRTRLTMRIRSLNWNLQKQAFEESLKPHSDSIKLRRSLSSLLENEELHPEVVALLREKFEFYYSEEKKAVLGKDTKTAQLLQQVGIYHAPEQEKK